jgi:hypothetical protein
MSEQRTGVARQAAPPPSAAKVAATPEGHNWFFIPCFPGPRVARLTAVHRHNCRTQMHNGGCHPVRSGRGPRRC